MMKQIEVDIDVFSMIWSLRSSPEKTENEILYRILSESLSVRDAETSPERNRPHLPTTKEVNTSNSIQGESEMTEITGKIRWVDDVENALHQLGGSASLHTIYKKVKELRKVGGRSLPQSLEATIRRTIEDHSSDSDNFRGADKFKKISRGEWGVR
jgi:negative regulator of replication initiation